MSGELEPELTGDDAFVSRFPVHRACRDGDVVALVSLLQQLSNRAHLTAEDSCHGWTPLHWAAHHGQLECVVLLVQMGCEVNTASSRFNQTPTHTAAFGGHPHCVVWLSQAGADVNRQDFVGEAPIHKAARSGSLECIQVLLIAGAKPHLRNADGQTAADLAHAHGFSSCFRLISDDRGRESREQDGSPACGRAPPGGKRPLAAVDGGHAKKARRTDNAEEEVESMNVESAQVVGSDDRHETPPSPPPAGQRRSADMCGSLHLTGSPGSCASHRPAWWGPAGADCGGPLHYGHYHGFGDTAEELSDGGGTLAERRHKQASSGSVHLYHGS